VALAATSTVAGGEEGGLIALGFNLAARGLLIFIIIEVGGLDAGLESGLLLSLRWEIYFGLFLLSRLFIIIIIIDVGGLVIVKVEGLVIIKVEGLVAWQSTWLLATCVCMCLDSLVQFGYYFSSVKLGCV